VRNVLVLNLDNDPMNVTTFKRAVRLLFAGKAEVLHGFSGRIRSTSGLAFPLPSVIRMLYYVTRRPKRVALTKKNVLLRDEYRCGYCSQIGDRATMTVDHVVPKSAGGKGTWKNLVAACAFCNGRKKNRTPEQAGMPLLRKPREPRYIPFVVIKAHTAPDEWRKYLTLWSIGIEERLA
jgi:5-methylcytosine-specific restriction endonuclease McrA